MRFLILVLREAEPDADPTPGKTTALFQASEFLEWLRTAEESDAEADA